MPNVDYIGPARASTWRRVAAASWAPPQDPTIYGMLDVDARPMRACIERLAERGVRVTVTHVVAWGVARALALHPDLNVMIRGRRAWRRERVDVFLQVVMPGDGGGAAELTGVRIKDADKLSLAEFAGAVTTKVGLVRQGHDEEVARTRRGISGVPHFMLPFVMRVVRRLTYRWNWDLSRFGIARDPFGSAGVTSLGMLGVDTAFAPLFPMGGPPILIAVGQIIVRPWVDEHSGEIVARPVLRLAGTFDHRAMDGWHLAEFARDVVAILERGLDETEPELTPVRQAPRPH